MHEKKQASFVHNAQSAPSFHEQLAALRDFFASKNSTDLQNAYGRLGLSHNVYDINWRDVEYAFNRLFVGPMAIEAPPYASVYLEPEPQMMGRTTLEVRELYHELSLSTPQSDANGMVPDDHISLELDAVLALLAVEDWCHGLDGPSAVETECRVHLTWLAEHMAAWVPQFTERTCQKTVQYDEQHDAKSSTQSIMQDTMTALLSNIEHLYHEYKLYQ